MNIIAIDGPSGVGKGKIASSVAKLLNYEYLDSGVFYRIAAYIAIVRNINNELDLVNEYKKLHINIKGSSVRISDSDITKEIRTTEVDNIVGEISKIIPLRLEINAKIQEYAKGKNIVVDGRDISTTVLPTANKKIFLTADIETRAKRRYNQYLEKGINSSYKDIYENIEKRDKIDKEREIGALLIANDAIVIDTSNLKIDEVINKVLNYVKGE